MKGIYLIGSLRNPKVPTVGAAIRKAGFDVFDDWFAAGEIADDRWRDYERNRGRDYASALRGRAAEHVFDFDKFHIDRCNIGVLYLPAGKSGHMELGVIIGQGKPGYILMDGEPADGRWDVMYRFAIESGGGVFFDLDELIVALQRDHG